MGVFFVEGFLELQLKTDLVVIVECVFFLDGWFLGCDEEVAREGLLLRRRFLVAHGLI